MGKKAGGGENTHTCMVSGCFESGLEEGQPGWVFWKGEQGCFTCEGFLARKKRRFGIGKRSPMNHSVNSSFATRVRKTVGATVLYPRGKSVVTEMPKEGV